MRRVVLGLALSAAVVTLAVTRANAPVAFPPPGAAHALPAAPRLPTQLTVPRDRAEEEAVLRLARAAALPVASPATVASAAPRLEPDWSAGATAVRPAAVPEPPRALLALAAGALAGAGLVRRRGLQ